MKNTITVAELIAMLEKVEDKNTVVEFHSTSNSTYKTTIEKVETHSFGLKRTTITIK